MLGNKNDRSRGIQNQKESHLRVVWSSLPLASSIQLAREVLHGWNTKTLSLVEIRDPQTVFHLSHTGPWACWNADFYDNTTSPCFSWKESIAKPRLYCWMRCSRSLGLVFIRAEINWNTVARLAGRGAVTKNANFTGSWAGFAVFVDSVVRHGNRSCCNEPPCSIVVFSSTLENRYRRIPICQVIEIFNWTVFSTTNFLILDIIIFAEKVRLANIHEAVRYGDVLELQSMVQRGAGINDIDSKFKLPHYTGQLIMEV